MTTQTHETYIQAIVALAMLRLDAREQQKVADAKIVYGAGSPRTRGVTYFGGWENGGGPEAPHAFVEICAFCEADPVQLAGTTLHEIAHVLAGHQAGHGAGWKETCNKLGLRSAKAAGMQYCMAAFDPPLRDAIARLDSPGDGKPIVTRVNARPRKPRPCSSTVGSHGGKSRGKGSGSRMLKLSCRACGYTVRTTAKWLATGVPLCHCNHEPMAGD